MTSALTTSKSTRSRRRSTDRRVIAVVQTEEFCEGRVTKLLRRAGIQSWSPEFLERDAKGVPHGRKLFPEYIFTWINLQEGDVSAVLDIPGVIDFVRTTGSAEALTVKGVKKTKGLIGTIDPSFIDGLRSMCNPFGYVNLHTRFKAGDLVRYGGLGVGVVAGMVKQERVDVLFSLLGRSVKIAVSVCELEQADLEKRAA